MRLLYFVIVKLLQFIVNKEPDIKKRVRGSSEFTSVPAGYCLGFSRLELRDPHFFESKNQLQLKIHHTIKMLCP